jgi:hypothetical protein
MSFWFDDDDPYSQKQSQSQASRLGQESEFECQTCGATESYHDSATGREVCTVCYTQSQAITQDAEMEVEDVMALAAKTKSGRLLQRRQRTGGKRGREKFPMEPLNSAVKLPDLDTCLKGMRRVFKICIERIGDLLYLEDEHRATLDQNVKGLWLAYLRSWADGAEYYGKRYPEVRISLRDQFFYAHKAHVPAIYRHLSYKAAQRMKEAEDCSRTENEEKRDPIFDSSDEEGKEEAWSEHIRSSTKKRPRTGKSTDSSILDPVLSSSSPDLVASKPTFIASGNDGKKVTFRHDTRKSTMTPMLYAEKEHLQKDFDRKDAALYSAPSMKLVLALVWTAVSRYGVSSIQILKWVYNGSLPLFNAFNLFEDKLKKELAPIASFFQMPKPPTQASLVEKSRYLLIACGLKSPDAFGGPWMEHLAASNDRRIPPDSAPRALAQIVADLGFGQQVLDIALALMGLKDAAEKSGLPQPLVFAQPDRLFTVDHLLALVACSVQFVPAWRAWKFRRPLYRSRKRAKRYVPWNEDGVRFLGNGPSLEGYLDFLDEAVFSTSNSVIPEFSNSLDYTAPPPPDHLILDNDDEDSCKKAGEEVGPCEDFLLVDFPHTAGEENFLDHLMFAIEDKLRIWSHYGREPLVLDRHQELLIDMLGYYAETDARLIHRALQDLLGTGRASRNWMKKTLRVEVRQEAKRLKTAADEKRKESKQKKGTTAARRSADQAKKGSNLNAGRKQGSVSKATIGSDLVADATQQFTSVVDDSNETVRADASWATEATATTDPPPQPLGLFFIFDNV